MNDVRDAEKALCNAIYSNAIPLTQKSHSTLFSCFLNRIPSVKYNVVMVLAWLALQKKKVWGANRRKYSAY